MEKAARLKLKQFLEDNIPFDALKKVGFFENGIRKTDYEKIAERVCQFFGYKSIYEYGEADDLASPDVDMFCPTTWKKLEVNKVEMISKDSWLN